MARGIEIFGSAASTVTPRQPEKTRRLGALALLAAGAAALLCALGVVSLEDSQPQLALVLAIAAIVVSILAALAGVVALVTGRGRLLGFIAVPLALAANPLLLSRLLEYAASL